MSEDNFEEINPELDEELLKKRLFPVVIRPNLGQPDFISPLNYNEENDKELPEKLFFEFNVMVAACKKSKIKDLIEEFDKRFYLYPICDKFTDGRAKRLEKIPLLSKNFQVIKSVQIDDPSYNNHPQIYLETEQVFPGRNKYYDIKIIFTAPSSIFYHEHEEHGYFKEKTRRNFLMCDIVYDLSKIKKFEIDSADDNYIKYYCSEMGEPPDKLMRINYHALVLTLKNMKNTKDIKIWHATDLHITKRNDDIPHHICKEMSNNGMREKDSELGLAAEKELELAIGTSYGSDEIIKNINMKINDPAIHVFELFEDMKLDKEEFFWKLPIEYRVQNPNNNLRLFIYQANEAYKRNELDFIALTGDLIDFVTPRTSTNYEFKNSNWKVFLDIILGKPEKMKFGGILPPEELIVPIFTIPGNHDYKGHTYPVTILGKNAGIKEEEGLLYPKVGKWRMLKALSSNIKYLRGYLQFINPDLNFIKKIGKTHFVFLDTDKDSMIDITDYINGSPSTKGFRNRQMRWLKRYCNDNLKDDENIIFFTHAPPLNPPKIEMTKEIIKEIYPNIKNKENETGKELTNMNLLKEYSLIEIFDDPRVDPIVDLKFGTILKNWEEMLHLLLNCKSQGISKSVNLVLSGHTHKNLEFRLEPLMGRELQKIPYIEILPFYKKQEIPCAIYMGNYSNEYKAEIEYLNSLEIADQQIRFSNSELIINKHPFLVQTTSLGPRSQREDSSIQGFRKLYLKNNRIESFNVCPLLRCFIPFAKLIKDEK